MRSKATRAGPDPASARGTERRGPRRQPQGDPRRRDPQRTIARSIVMGGQGLHTGLKTGVILHPAPRRLRNRVLLARRRDRDPSRFENVTDTGYNTTLTSGGRSVRTVEHLMSALHAFGITNLLVKTDDEVPALDGSALEFCSQLAEAGVTEQDATVEPIRIKNAIVIGEEGEGREFIHVEPADHLIIDYTLDYPKPIGVQHVHFELTSRRGLHARNRAGAHLRLRLRSFASSPRWAWAAARRLDNVILVDDDKVVNTTLRFPDEFARHKVLDLIGDLYLLGPPLHAHSPRQRPATPTTWRW